MEKKEFEVFKASEEDSMRFNKEEPHKIRSSFQRDRDRILYSKEFRRLSSKTQVFVTGFDDNMRTRLTHTLEVSQIACTIANYFGLDIILVEAIALGHDVGHTPFGHVGERTLNYFTNGCLKYYHYGKNGKDIENHFGNGFKHNIQSVRVLMDLEKMNLDYPGLNLTQYTLWGILHHSDIEYENKCNFYNEENLKCTYRNSKADCPLEGQLSTSFYEKYLNQFDETSDWTFEGIIVSVADEIAQRHHDIEDGVYANIINIKEVIDKFVETFNDFLDPEEKLQLESTKTINEKEIYISQLSKVVVNFYVNKYIQDLEEKLNILKKSFNLQTIDDFNQKKIDIYKKSINNNNSITKYFGYNKDFMIMDKDFQQYLCQIILTSELAQSMDGKATFIIKRLIKAYLSNFQQLPDNTILLINDDLTKEGLITNEYKVKTISNSLKVSQARKNIKSLQKKGDPNFETILLRRICDFIAGMTDKFAMKQYEKLYGTNYY
jgi:dGTPase